MGSLHPLPALQHAVVKVGRVFPLLALNKGWADFRRCPRLVFDVTEGEDIKTYADALPKLVGIGMRIPTQWAHETLRIPLPSSDEEEVLAVAKPATPTPPEPGQEPKVKAKKADTKAALLAALRDAATEFPDQDALDGALEDLAPALQPQVAAWLKPALDALEKASGPEAALALLASENPLTDDVVLVEAIARALFVTELLGAEGVRQELKP